MNKKRFIFSNNKKLRSLLLFVCLFFLATIIPPVVAEVSAPPSNHLTNSPPLPSPPQVWGGNKKIRQDKDFQKSVSPLSLGRAVSFYSESEVN